jgi:spoIIIJ-associated protein
MSDVDTDTAETTEPAAAPESSATETDATDDAVDEAGDDATDDATDDAADEAPARGNRLQQLEREGDIAADYLEELLDIADLDGDLDMDVDGDRAAVSIVGADLSQLIGPDGEVLEALQELTRLAVFRETGDRSRLMLDISGYRADKREQLVELAERLCAQVKETGEPVSLDPMSPFERKVVHDTVAAAGLASESEGAEPRRFVVIVPA